MQIPKHHQDSSKILCSMLSHVCCMFTFIMPMQWNADINWKSNWYAHCCDLMVLQNNRFNVNVLCAVLIVPGLWVQFVPTNRLTAYKYCRGWTRCRNDRVSQLQKKTTHANSKTPPWQLQYIEQHVIACIMKIYMHHANATKCWH